MSLEHGRLGATAVQRPSAWVRWLAAANAVANLAIIGTGGAVRLTGSGLGCSTWPSCTPDSFIPTAEQGVHGLIEFANRAFSGVLLLLAVGLVVALWRQRRQRRDLWGPACIVLGGVLLQALIGAFVVWLHLHANLVGFHYLLSIVLVGVATALVLRAWRSRAPRVRAIPGWLYGLTHLATALLAAVVVLGVLTTGSGPHSGDESVIRDSSLWAALAHLHANLAYGLTGLVLVLLIGGLVARNQRYLLAVGGLLAVIAVQIMVGIAQVTAEPSLPALLVGVHMVLAGLSIAAAVALVDSAKRAAE